MLDKVKIKENLPKRTETLVYWYKKGARAKTMQTTVQTNSRAKGKWRKILLKSCLLAAWATTGAKAAILVEQVSPLLQCLAKEEEQIHRQKVKGPIVELNQEMLALFATIRQLRLKPLYRKQICQSSSAFTPSLGLLQIILLHGKQPFYSTSQEPSYRGFQESFLTSLSSTASRLFMNYLSAIQALTPRSHCLREHIPPLRKIYQQYKTLEEHIATQHLIEPSDLSQVFAGLSRLDEIVKACNQPSAPKI